MAVVYIHNFHIDILRGSLSYSDRNGHIFYTLYPYLYFRLYCYDCNYNNNCSTNDPFFMIGPDVFSLIYNVFHSSFLLFYVSPIVTRFIVYLIWNLQYNSFFHNLYYLFSLLIRFYRNIYFIMNLNVRYYTIFI